MYSKEKKNQVHECNSTKKIKWQIEATQKLVKA
jgi:hypothetical protein